MMKLMSKDGEANHLVEAITERLLNGNFGVPSVKR